MVAQQALDIEAEEMAVAEQLPIQAGFRFPVREAGMKRIPGHKQQAGNDGKFS
jgi:hypothetical protein